MKELPSFVTCFVFEAVVFFIFCFFFLTDVDLVFSNETIKNNEEIRPKKERVKLQ